MKKSRQRQKTSIVDRKRSLQQLEHADWGEPPFPSHLVTTVYRLRRTPLRDFTTEDLRLMIGQDLSLRFLMPIALELLEADPFVAGDFGAGDLLRTVLRANLDFWQTHPDLRASVDTLLQQAIEQRKARSTQLGDEQAQEQDRIELTGETLSEAYAFWIKRFTTDTSA